VESRQSPLQGLQEANRRSSSGLGFETVKALARHGAKVYLTARDRHKGLDAIERIKAAGLSPGNGQIELLELDLAEPKLAKSAAEVFLKKEKRLDILVNNAAVYVFLLQLGLWAMC
jgi:NAD(P)-dependent dehydrogenase (short-subunit alcohol dehydrogenase family)